MIIGDPNKSNNAISTLSFLSSSSVSTFCINPLLDLKVMIYLRTKEVVAQLVERSLPILRSAVRIQSSAKIYIEHLLSTVLKRQK